MSLHELHQLLFHHLGVASALLGAHKRLALGRMIALKALDNEMGIDDLSEVSK